MPSTFFEFLTDPEKVKILSTKGLDPNKYDIDSNGRFFFRNTPLNLTPQRKGPPIEQEGVLETAGRGAAQSLLPFLGGLGGAALAGAAAPATGGLSALIPILGAVGGGFGTAALQEAVVPEGVKEQLFATPEGLEQNPTTAFLSQFLPALLAFNPAQGIKQIPDVGRALGKLVGPAGQQAGRSAITAQQANLLKNLGISSALEGTIEGAQQAFDPNVEFSPARIAAAALSGLVLNEPNALGRKAFGLRGSADTPENVISPRAFPEEVTKLLGAPREVRGLLPAPKEPAGPIRKTGEAIPLGESQSQIRARDFEAARREELKQTLESGGEPQPEVRPKESPTAPKDQEARLRASEEELAAPTTEAESIQAKQDKIIDDIKTGRKKRQEESIFEQTRKESIRNLPDDIAQKLADMTLDEARKRGFKVKVVEQLRDPRTNKPFLGDFDTNTQTIRISREAAADTGFHEIHHGVLRDLATSTAKRDRDLVMRGLESAPNITASERIAIDNLREAMNSGNHTTVREILDGPSLVRVQEFLAQGVGQQRTFRAEGELTGNKPLKLRNYLQGVKAHLKSKLGIANDKDLMTFLAARQELDAPFGTRPELAASGRPLSFDDLAPETTEAKDTEETPTKTTPTKKGSTSTTKSEPKVNEPTTKSEAASPESTPSKTEKKSVAKETLEGLEEGKLTKVEAKIKAQRADLNKKSKQPARAFRQEESDFVRKQVNERTQRLLKRADNIEVVDPASKPPGGFWLGPDGTVVSVRQGEADFKAGNFHADAALRIAQALGIRVPDVAPSLRNINKKLAAEHAILQAKWLRGIRFKGLNSIDLGQTSIRPKPNKEQSVWLEHQILSNGFEVFVDGSKYELGSKGETSPEPKRVTGVQRFRQAQSNLPRISFEEASNRANKTAEKVTEFYNKLEPSEVTAHLHNHPNPAFRGFLKVLGSATDKVRLKGSKDSQTAFYVADKLDVHAAISSELDGPFRNKIQSIIQEYNPEDIKVVNKYVMDLDPKSGKGESPIRLTAKQKELHKRLRAWIEEIPEQNLRREIEKIENYIPHVISQNVIKSWLKDVGSKESQGYINDWVDYIVKRKKQPKEMSDEDFVKQVRTDVLDYISALTGKGGDLSKFKALTSPAGVGMPRHMQEQELARRLTRYGHRVALDIARHRVIDTDNIMLAAMGEPNSSGKRVHTEDIGNLPEEYGGGKVVPLEGTEISNLKQMISGEINVTDSPQVTAWARLINSSLLGPATQIRNTIQIPLNIAPAMNRLTNWKLFAKALKQSFSKEMWKEALLVNARTKKLGNLEFQDSGIHPNRLTAGVVNLADFFRKLQGRDFGENAERVFQYSLGKLVAMEEFGRVFRTGDKRAVEWLKKFGKTVPGLNDLLKPGKSLADVPDEVLQKIAKSFTDRASGTYDQRGLPAGALKGQLAPFFALSKWSIERSNIVYKDVIIPAIEHGNFKPLVGYTLGAVLTGKAIEEVSEFLNQSKTFAPKWEESIAAKNPEQAARSVVNLLQLSAYMGIVSDVMRLGTEIYSGNPVPRAPISFPLVTWMGDTLGKNTSHYATAMRTGEDPWLATRDYLLDILTSTMQGGRLVANFTWNQEDKLRSQKFRDVRVFRELMGLAEPGTYVQSNPYMDPIEREFKRTDDLALAAQLAPKVTARQIEKSTINGKLNIEKLRKELKGAKTTSFQTVPNPETEPLTALEYLEFLKETQGPEVASERLKEFVTQKAINKAKGQLIPQL